MAKYSPLYDFLMTRDSNRVRLTFDEIAALIEDALPDSAFKYREWWANQSNTDDRPQAAAWLDAGFVVEEVQQQSSGGWVVFARDLGRDQTLA